MVTLLARRSNVLVRVALALAVVVSSILVAAERDRRAGAAADVFEPARLADTRSGSFVRTIDGLHAGDGAVRAGETYAIAVTSRAEVPSTVGGVYLNLTATEATGPGFLTAHSCDDARPETSNVNFTDATPVANAVLVRPSSDGRVCIYAHTTTHVVVDVTGYELVGEGPTPVTPARIVETRPSATPTVDGESSRTGKLNAGESYVFRVGGRARVPVDARAAFLNVTAVDATGPGFVTFFDCDRDRPNSSNLNYTPGDTVANLVFTDLDSRGRACFFVLEDVDVVVDVNGYVPSGGSPTAIVPARMTETRSGPGLGTIDGESSGVGRVEGGSTHEVRIAGRDVVPVSSEHILLNVTVVDPADAGFVTVFPCGADRPNASMVNYLVGEVVANTVRVSPGDDGRVCVFTLATTHLVVDVLGFSSDGDAPPTGTTMPTTTTVPTSVPTTAPTPTTSTTTTTAPPPPPPPDGPPPPGGPFVRSTSSFGVPLRWDPCPARITYRVDTSRSTDGMRSALDAAIVEIEAATGFDFVSQGTYTATYEVAGRPSRPSDAQVGFTFADESVTSQLAGSTIGFAVTSFAPTSGQIVAGTVTLDTDSSASRSKQILMHELGHLMGLDHVPFPTPGELMQPFDDRSLTGFGPGDLEGLWYVGAAQPCLFRDLPAARALEVRISHDHPSGEHDHHQGDPHLVDL